MTDNMKLKKIRSDVDFTKALFTRCWMKSTGYRVVSNGHGGEMQLSHALWNYYNPNDPVKSGEVVHHKNENSLDDKIENYEKLSKADHDKKHRMALSKAISKAQKGRKHSKASIEKRVKSYLKTREQNRKWSVPEVIALRKQGLSMRKVAARFGVHYSGIWKHFKKRGLQF